MCMKCKVILCPATMCDICANLEEGMSEDICKFRCAVDGLLVQTMLHEKKAIVVIDGKLHEVNWDQVYDICEEK